MILYNVCIVQLSVAANQRIWEEADHSRVSDTDIPPRLGVQKGLLSGSYGRAKKL